MTHDKEGTEASKSIWEVGASSSQQGRGQQVLGRLTKRSQITKAKNKKVSTDKYQLHEMKWVLSAIKSLYYSVKSRGNHDTCGQNCKLFLEDLSMSQGLFSSHKIIGQHPKICQKVANSFCVFECLIAHYIYAFLIRSSPLGHRMLPVMFPKATAHFCATRVCVLANQSLLHSGHPSMELCEVHPFSK